VMSISEVGDVDHDRVILEDIFRFERTGIGVRGKTLGAFAATGYKPKCLDRLKAYGVHIPHSVLEERVEIKEK